MSATKRTVEGIAVKGDGKYQLTDADVKERKWMFWRMSPGTNLKRDLIWEFQMQVRKDQLIRFPTESLFMHFNAKIVNGDYVSETSDPVDGKKDVRVSHYFLQPHSKAPSVYFEGALGAASFIDRVEVLVNGVPVPDTQGMGSFGYIYATQNKLYCSEKRRKDKYLRDIPRVSTSGDRDASKTDLSDDMKDSMESLQFDTAVASADMVERFTLDVSVLLL
jgi:hypothetical protein